MLNEVGNIRKIDYPETKEKVTSELFGQFIGFCVANGLTNGNEFATQIQEILQCSKKILWIDEFHPEFQITVYINSIQMFVEYGVVRKSDKKVIHRNKIENLRYKISSDSPLELIDTHQDKFNALFKEFEEWFNKLKNKSEIA